MLGQRILQSKLFLLPSTDQFHVGLRAVFLILDQRLQIMMFRREGLGMGFVHQSLSFPLKKTR